MGRPYTDVCTRNPAIWGFCDLSPPMRKRPDTLGALPAAERPVPGESFAEWRAGLDRVGDDTEAPEAVHDVELGMRRDDDRAVTHRPAVAEERDVAELREVGRSKVGREYFQESLEVL